MLSSLHARSYEQRCLDHEEATGTGTVHATQMRASESDDEYEDDQKTPRNIDAPHSFQTSLPMPSAGSQLAGDMDSAGTRHDQELKRKQPGTPPPPGAEVVELPNSDVADSANHQQPSRSPLRLASPVCSPVTASGLGEPEGSEPEGSQPQKVRSTTTYHWLINVLIV